MDTLLVLLPFVILGWFLLGGRWGVVCPGCGDTLPGFQSPFRKTWRQWWEGGYVCRNCGCEVDKAGNRVPRERLPGCYQ